VMLSKLLGGGSNRASEDTGTLPAFVPEPRKISARRHDAHQARSGEKLNDVAAPWRIEAIHGRRTSIHGRRILLPGGMNSSDSSDLASPFGRPCRGIRSIHRACRQSATVALVVESSRVPTRHKVEMVGLASSANAVQWPDLAKHPSSPLGGWTRPPRISPGVVFGSFGSVLPFEQLLFEFLRRLVGVRRMATSAAAGQKRHQLSSTRCRSAAPCVLHSPPPKRTHSVTIVRTAAPAHSDCPETVYAGSST